MVYEVFFKFQIKLISSKMSVLSIYDKDHPPKGGKQIGHSGPAVLAVFKDYGL